MRNYVNELIRIGYSEEAISKQANVSLSHIHKIAIGKVRDKAGTKTYEAIRNANRRIGRQYARQGGMTSQEADKYRREILNPQRKTVHRNTKVYHKSKSNQTYRQYYIFAEFTYPEDTTVQNKLAYGFSKSTKSPHVKTLREQAVNNAIAKLSGGFSHYYWQLVPPIIEEGFTTHVLTLS
jgi:hypothetical protein